MWFRRQDVRGRLAVLALRPDQPKLCAGQRLKKERKKTDNPREGWEDGTPPPHRDFKERGVMR